MDTVKVKISSSSSENLQTNNLTHLRKNMTTVKLMKHIYYFIHFIYSSKNVFTLRSVWDTVSF